MEESHSTEDTGKVVKVLGKDVWVEVQRSGGCKSCAMRGMCFKKSTPAVFHLSSDLPLNEGDLVTLEIAPGTRVMSALLIFALPLVFLFAGFIIAAQFLTELGAVAVAFGAMGLSFFIMRFCDRKLGANLRVEIGKKI